MRSFCCAAAAALTVLLSTVVAAQENMVANPGFETLAQNGFFANWGRGEFGKVGKTVAVDAENAHSGRYSLRMMGTPSTWTTCASDNIAVQPNTDYWIVWWFKAKQPASSRTYLFLQTNMAQRVFPQTDRRGDFDWTLNIARYHTKPGETSFHPVLTMQTSQQEIGTSWWDDIGVYRTLPADLEAVYRRDHPWDDVAQKTAQRFSRTGTCTVWGDLPEVRIYPQDAPPTDDRDAAQIDLTAPGRGHAIYQLVVTPQQSMEPLTLRFGKLSGPDAMPATSISYRVLQCVPVKEVRDKSFPLGPTPDPLVAPDQPVSASPGHSAIFWIEWAPPAGSKSGIYKSDITVLAGTARIADVPLWLHCWGFDLPAVPDYRSMVHVTPSEIRRLCPGLSDDEACRRGWDMLANYGLCGFNLAIWPVPSLQDGKLQIDWTRFDRMLEDAKRYHATAITIGPMFGGGCGEGWKPHVKFVGLTPLTDPKFDALYVEFNRRVGERLRKAGLIDKAYVYPYDEPEPDYMDKIARLCDLIHQGDPGLKCLMTVDPAAAQPLWGKVNAWIIPSSTLRSAVIAQRRAAGDEIWIYNMTAAIEDTPLAHRLYLWQAFRVDAAGGLLWNANWWNKINPWENPTAAAVPVGRKLEQLYHYQAGQASLFYPPRDGKGALVPSLRLALIRQGVEDFDLLTELCRSWQKLLPKLSAQAKADGLVNRARAALVAPVMLDMSTATTSPARVNAVRGLVGNELEAVAAGPAVVLFPTRVEGKLTVAGYVEQGTKLRLNGSPVTVSPTGKVSVTISARQLANGMKWEAMKGTKRKHWEWPGLQ